MAKPFNHSADNLQDFFSQAGRGFYIPYYQRNFSWDADNASKLMSDIFAAVKGTVSKPENTVFLGTVILHNEQDVKVGVHVDTPNLLTKVSNVVDGQQRITSLAMLFCVLREALGELAQRFDSPESMSQSLESLRTDLLNAQGALEQFYSVDIQRVNASPRKKPLIIRAGDVSVNPASDQWTLNGDVSTFYRSDTAMLLSRILAGAASQDVRVSDRIRSVLDSFTGLIVSELDSVSVGTAKALLDLSKTSRSTLQSFVSYPPEYGEFDAFDDVTQNNYAGGLLLLAVCQFVRLGCYLVVIECLDEGLAFDMFQALNATGTPLTAFEVFKPALVKTWGGDYSSEVKVQVDRIERVFELESSANGKEAITDRVVCSSALVYNGVSLSQRFSDERDWLMQSLPRREDALAKAFIACLADQAEYYRVFLRQRRPNRNSTTFRTAQELELLGLQADDADLAALCIFYLRDAQHQMSHSVLSVFYARLLQAQGSEMASYAGREFLAVCQATVAFFTFWMGALTRRFPDADYRKMFDQLLDNISVVSGVRNQNSTFVKRAYRGALSIQRVAGQRVYDEGDPGEAFGLWTTLASLAPWYQRRAVCRFALMAALNDAVADTGSNREGLLVDGLQGTNPLLSCRAWHDSNFEVLEHVATRDRPRNVTFPQYFDESIYPGNYSVVDRIGNLTLLSTAVNSSIYSEWPQKTFFYWSLTMPSSAVVGPAGSQLMTALGLSTLPPSLSSLQAGSNYLPHLAPLAVRGIAGQPWDGEFIRLRSEHICGRVFNKLDAWLR